MNGKLPDRKQKFKKLTIKPQNIMLLLIILAVFYVINFINVSMPQKEIKYGDFYRILKENPATGQIVHVTRIDNRLEGELKDKTRFLVVLPEGDKDIIALLRENVPDFEIRPPSLILALVGSLGPIAIIILFWWLMAARGEQLGNRIMGFGKIKPKLAEEGKGQKVTFNDVAGVDEAREELQEVIEFLKDPKKFQKLGGKIPKGVLLVGPPGCGKCVTGDSIILTNKGPLKIKDVPKYFYIDGADKVLGAKVSSLSPNPLATIESPASQWYNLGQAKTLDIRTRLGNCLSGTYEHPVLAVSDSGDLVFKRLDQLKIGDFVAIKYDNQMFGSLSGPTPEMAYFLGLLVGDGCTTIRDRICFSTRDKELLNFVKNFVKNSFGYSLKKGTRPADYEIFNKEAFEQLRGLGLKETYSKNKEIPDTILLSPKKVVVSFLRGLFDTDGYVEKSRGCVLFSSSSKKLVEQVSVFLLNLGIVNHLYSRPIRKYNRMQYYIEISGDFLNKFKEEIGFGLSRKKKPLDVCLARTRNTNVNIIPNQHNNIRKVWEFLVNSGSRPSLKTSISFHKNILRYITQDRRPSLNALRNFVEMAGKINPQVKNLEEYIHLKRIVESQIFFTPVVDINKGQDAVYDFTIKDAHNFIANGFVSHNTLVAKAVSGEAGVPFFSISGSDFVEMFVGVGASRVRDLFEQGRKAAKISGKGAIIFIDEIDAVGRLRFAGIGGGHDEREQTLNQLLVEMDGFDTQEGLILIAATNRPDTLDPALLRPGRFDRLIVVNLPDIAGREAILKVHVRKIKLAPSVDLKVIAQHTSLFSGADLANLCNEAALLAARNNKEAVEQSDLEAAIERVIMGPEKKSRIMSKREKELTAFHEAGHAILSLLVPEVDPVTKVSIIPRGMSGGYTLTPPREDKRYRSKNEFIGDITVCLGGRVSEELTFGDITTGAGRDLEVATQMARQMVCDYGMSERLGNVTLGKSHGPVFLGRDLVEEKNYSDETARIIDEEVKRIIDGCYGSAKKLIQDNLEKLKLLANTLLEREVLNGEEVRRMLGMEVPSPEEPEKSGGHESNRPA